VSRPRSVRSGPACGRAARLRVRTRADAQDPRSRIDPSPTPLWRRARDRTPYRDALKKKGAAPIGGNRCRLGSTRIGGNLVCRRPRIDVRAVPSVWVPGPCASTFCPHL
jgi:hypothetical protein